MPCLCSRAVCTLAAAALLVGAGARPAFAELGAPISRLQRSTLLPAIIAKAPCSDPAPPVRTSGYRLSCFQAVARQGVFVYAYADPKGLVAVQSVRINMTRFGGDANDVMLILTSFATEATAKRIDHPRLYRGIITALERKTPVTYFDGRYLVEVNPPTTNPQIGLLSLTIGWASLLTR